tara:strand:- start:535 stop:744 length:210 start_codon:yes stop_codon:yes gene_type:complete
MGVVELLYVFTAEDATPVVNVDVAQKFVHITNTNPVVAYALHICFVAIIDKNIIVGNVIQKSFVFTIIG